MTPGGINTNVETKSLEYRYAGSHQKPAPLVLLLVLALIQYVFWKEVPKADSSTRTGNLVFFGLGSAMIGSLLFVSARMKLKKPVFLEIDVAGVRAPCTKGQTLLWRDIVEIRFHKDLWLHEHLDLVVANDKEYLERLPTWMRWDASMNRRSKGTVFSCLITSMDTPAEEIKRAVSAAWNTARQAMAEGENSADAPSKAPSFDAAAVRRTAWFKTVFGFLGTTTLVGIVMALSARGVQFKNPFYFIPLAVPFVYFSIGMVELIAGVPMDCLSERWMSLKGWQRGVLGTLIVLLSIAVVFTAVALAVVMKVF